jgi:hypothetical protein
MKGLYSRTGNVVHSGDEERLGRSYEQPVLNEIKPGFLSVSIHLCGEIAAQKWRTSSRSYILLSLGERQNRTVEQV